jgi:tetratricopeptide (TPR) repeat protein
LLASARLIAQKIKAKEMNMMIRNRRSAFVAMAALAVICGFAAAKEKTGGGKTGPGMAEYERGIQLFDAKQYDQAVVAFSQAILANDKEPAFYEDRGFTYLAMQMPAEGAADFSKVIELAPNEERAYVGRAQALILQKTYDQALGDLEQAFKLKRDDPLAYKFRGFAEIGLAASDPTQWDKAVADFTAAIEKNPNDPENYDRRAFAYRNLKNFPAAITDYTTILNQNPNDEQTLAKRGYTYSLMQDYEKAIADYQQALKLKPEDNDTFSRLQYAQSMLAARNAPAAAATPTPTPVAKPSLFAPLNIGIAVAVLIVIAVIWRLATRGRTEPTSHIIR